MGLSTRRLNIDGIKNRDLLFSFYCFSFFLLVSGISIISRVHHSFLVRSGLESFSVSTYSPSTTNLDVKGVPNWNADLSGMGLSQIASAVQQGLAN